MAAVDYRTNFSKQLKELKKRDGVTIKQLADRLYLSTREIDYYIKGERLPSIEVLYQVAGYFCVSIDYLLMEDIKKMNPYSTTIIAELLNLSDVNQIKEIHNEPFSDLPTSFAAKQSDLTDLRKHIAKLFGTTEGKIQYRYTRDICVKYSENRKKYKVKFSI